MQSHSHFRTLIIRGGAIGDFVLTLPALSLLREQFPEVSLEILGYESIIALAHGRHYAMATRSIEYGPLARFFIPKLALPEELVHYFSSFDQVISYLFDPDNTFADNLRRAGVKNLLQGPGKLDATDHAARQLARPLEQMALYLETTAATLHPAAADQARAAAFLGGTTRPVIAIHPGSGGTRKNWPLENWQQLGKWVQRHEAQLLLVGGEAEGDRLDALAGELRNPLIARNLPLPHLAAILQRCALFLGHDSGISHIAAAVDTPCILLFGPTDPAVWAPTNPRVRILRSPDGTMESISLADFQEQIAQEGVI